MLRRRGTAHYKEMSDFCVNEGIWLDKLVSPDQWSVKLLLLRRRFGHNGNFSSVTIYAVGNGEIMQSDFLNGRYTAPQR